MRLTITIITSLLVILGLSLNLGGCQSRYRYPCQDPANWGKSECHNDACKAEGTCTQDTLGNRTDINTTESEPDPDPDAPPHEENSQEKTEEPHIPAISNNTVSECKQPEKKINFNVKSMPPPPMTPPVETVEAHEGEQPLTMDTVVETNGHNLAAR